MKPSRRNPGPSWGYSLVRFADRWLPEPVFKFVLHLGATIAVPLLPDRARASREFLDMALDRPSTWWDVRHHFIVFADFLVLRFRVAGGQPHHCYLDPEQAGDFLSRVKSPGIVLFGTVHLGHSDLLGFWLTDFDRSVRMLRVRMENSNDLRWLHERYAGKVEFIWTDEPAEIPFAIRDALEAGHSIAMQCDRAAYSSKTGVFEFLGKQVVFPTTIYHLSLIFRLPVVLAFGLDDGSGKTRVLSMPAFEPGSGDRASELTRAHQHFQRAVTLIESIARSDPFQWFNFEPLVQSDI